MNTLNKWVGYIDRSYEQIKQSLISNLQTHVPEITDYSESNILVVLMSQFAGVAELLNYYIDVMARESYLEVAQLYSSGYKLTRLTDYRTKSYVAASVDVTFTLLSSGVPVEATSPYSVPAGTIIATPSGIQFILVTSANFEIGDSEATATARQGETQTNVSLGTATGVAEQKVLIQGQYSEGTMNLEVDGDMWELCSTLAFSSLIDPHYITEVYSDGSPYIKFGGVYNGKLPTAGQSVVGTYETCLGSEANNILPGGITEIVTALTLPGFADEITVTNEIAPSGGADIESLESIRFRAPLDTRTLERAVTFQDFIDLALLVPGVKHAKVKYCCGSDPTIYIAPEGGGIASTYLLTVVSEFFKCRKIFTLNTVVAKAGTTKVFFGADVYGKYRFNAETVLNSVIDAINENYKYDNSEINRIIRISDLIGIMENLREVDYVDNNYYIYTEPYARPLLHTTELTWNRITKPGSVSKIAWKLVYGASGFQIFRDTVYMGTYAVGITYTDDYVEFTILPGIYTVGMTWEFYTYNYGDDLVIDDFTVPVIDETTLIITAYSQNKSFTCKPNC